MDNNDHSREHSYEHVHMHDHDHDFVRFEIPASTVKDLALLEYMLEHNKQHAHELADLGIRLTDAGYESAAELVHGAVLDFNQANTKLKNSIDLISESGGA